METHRWQVILIGDFKVICNDSEVKISRGQQSLLFAYLAMHPGMQSRDTLIETVGMAPLFKTLSAAIIRTSGWCR